MHQSAMKNCEFFFNTYCPHIAGDNTKIIEIGSQDVNGSLRTVAPSNIEYIGVDFVEGKGVDVILDDPYTLPFEDNSADIIVSNSCFEHSEMFWLVFLEVMRVLKPHGLFYLNVPSNGKIHRYPVDCWRFYPDSGHALVTWAKRNHIDAALLESYTSKQAMVNSIQTGETWNDYVGVFLKDQQHLNQYPNRILQSHASVYNGWMQLDGQEHNIKASELPEDHIKMHYIQGILNNQCQLP